MNNSRQHLHLRFRRLFLGLCAFMQPDISQDQPKWAEQKEQQQEGKKTEEDILFEFVGSRSRRNYQHFQTDRTTALSDRRRQPDSTHGKITEFGLTATDQSGVKKIAVRTNNGSFEDYRTPLVLSAYVTHDITYWAEDVVGNRSEERTIRVEGEIVPRGRRSSW